jgi:hypothetical protein
VLLDQYDRARQLPRRNFIVEKFGDVRASPLRGRGCRPAWLALIALVQITTENAASTIRPARDPATQRNVVSVCVAIDIFRSADG